MRAIFRAAAGSALALSLFACASTNVLEPQNNARDAKHARIHFVRPKAIVGMGLSPDIKVNGQLIGNLAVGSAFFVDRPAGQYRLTLDHEFEPGVFNRDVTLAAGQSYYFQVVQGGGAPVYVVIGTTVAPINGGGSRGEGPFQLKALDEKQGQALINSVQN